jgi:hypothetical protein
MSVCSPFTLFVWFLKSGNACPINEVIVAIVKQHSAEVVLYVRLYVVACIVAVLIFGE